MSQLPCPGKECCDEVYTYSSDQAIECLFEVILSTDPEDSGTTSGAGRYAAGSTANIDVVANLISQVAVGLDLVVVVDESGTMGAAWAGIPGIITSLQTQLAAAGIGSGFVHNRFGLVGQGIHKSADSHYTPTTVLGEGVNYFMGGTELWADVDPDNPTPGLNKIVSACSFLGLNNTGGVAAEDAYAGIDKAIIGRTWRNNVARIILFFTDEDRNYPVYSAQGVLQDYYVYPDFDFGAQRTRLANEIFAWGGSIHGAVNVRIIDSLSASVLGQQTGGKTYKADGAGGFTTGTGGNYNGESGTNTGLDGNLNLYLPSTVREDYYDLIVATPKCTVWDYQKFNLGGLDQTSFVASLVDSLKGNIITQVTWVFDGWFLPNGTLHSATTPFSITVNSNLTFEAKFHTNLAI